MEIGPLKSAPQAPGFIPTTAPVRDKGYMNERFTDSSANDNSWRGEADQLNQLAQMARMRGYR